MPVERAECGVAWFWMNRQREHQAGSRVLDEHCFFEMGRRKSKRKPPPKKKMTGNLDTQFTCPFCNHEKSCDVKMERTRNTGVISCTVCLEEFQTPITYLSEPVDVYSDWIDACEAANQ
ncbi:mRNAion elongation factor 1-like protein isoform X5 [Huso huso]